MSGSGRRLRFGAGTAWRTTARAPNRSLSTDVGVLGMTEVAKPALLRSRRGAWFRSGEAEIHVGIEEGFAPARKAHPGVAVSDVDALAAVVAASGAPVCWDDSIVGLRRFHTTDPVGNRLEFQQAR